LSLAIDSGSGFYIHLRAWKQKTFAIVAVMIAATAAFALAPVLASSAMAAKGEVKSGDGTTTECIHNGNGRTTEGSCSNPSGITQTTTCITSG
jgi:hypothetical protein